MKKRETLSNEIKRIDVNKRALQTLIKTMQTPTEERPDEQPPEPSAN